MASKRGPRRARPQRRAPTPRLKPELREQHIIAAAAHFFAREGFAGGTRELARRLGVTQALLYRYFPSKERLIDRVYQRVFVDRWDAAWDTLLVARSIGLAERLTRFYREYLGRSTETSMRLFIRGNLDNVGLARRYSVPLTERILGPICAELRREAGLPGLAAHPMTRGERELAMALHGGMIFIGIRRYIYGMAIPDVDDVVALHVRAFLEQATDVATSLMRHRQTVAMAVPVVPARPRRTRRR